MLDEFQATSISQPKPTSTAATPAASGPGRPSTEGGASKDEVPPEEDLAKDLQASMSNLINELDQNPDMQKEFEKMMQELIAAGVTSPEQQQVGDNFTKANETAAPSGAGTSAAAPTSSSSKKTGTTEDKFQDTIRKTMERMQASGDAATAASTSKQAKGEEALLEQMMATLLEGSGGDGDGDFNSMLMSMMAQLTHKDILYEPMKELNDKFPGWIEKNGSLTSKEDMARYEKQHKLVGEIVTRFEKSSYSDDNSADRDYIVERMQEMQSAGSPPEDLVGDMAAAQEALGDLDAGCPTQ